jgi:hypothetical protein
VTLEIEKTGKNKTAVLKDLAKTSGVSLLTLQSVEKGATLRLYDKAKAISQATKGVVSVDELCDGGALEVAPLVKKTAAKAKIKEKLDKLEKAKPVKTGNAVKAVKK